MNINNESQEHGNGERARPPSSVAPSSLIPNTYALPEKQSDLSNQESSKASGQNEKGGYLPQSVAGCLLFGLWLLILIRTGALAAGRENPLIPAVVILNFAITPFVCWKLYGFLAKRTDETTNSGDGRSEEITNSQVSRTEETKYFEVEWPMWGDGACSDPECPCEDVTIPTGTGYLWVSKDLVDFRKDLPRIEDIKRKYAGRVMAFGPGVAAPILMCEQAARRRGIDMDVAAADARHWWKTKRVPFRPTPMAGVSASPKEANRSGSSNISMAVYTFSRTCGPCGKTLEKYQGGFGGRMAQSEGVNCPACRKTWCNACHPPSRGQACQQCGGQLECNFG